MANKRKSFRVGKIFFNIGKEWSVKTGRWWIGRGETGNNNKKSEVKEKNDG